MTFNKRSVILLVTIFAVAGVLYLKTIWPSKNRSEVSHKIQSTPKNKSTLYLFHNPKDQDEECRRIYAFADLAERDLADRVTVQRPDVDKERPLLDQYSVHVLPTILIMSPDGKEQGRFEGEGDGVAADLEKALQKLKHQ